MLKLNQRYISLDIFWDIISQQVDFINADNLSRSTILADKYQLVTKHPLKEFYLYKREGKSICKYVFTNKLLEELPVV